MSWRATGFSAKSGGHETSLKNHTEHMFSPCFLEGRHGVHPKNPLFKLPKIHSNLTPAFNKKSATSPRIQLFTWEASFGPLKKMALQNDWVTGVILTLLIAVVITCITGRGRPSRHLLGLHSPKSQHPPPPPSLHSTMVAISISRLHSA